MKKINIARMLRDARGKYGRYNNPEIYYRGAARELALRDQLCELWEELYPDDRYPDIAIITGNQWENSDRPEDFDDRIAIGGGWYFYTNNGYNTVLQGK